jgi:hypothetical protein
MNGIMPFVANAMTTFFETFKLWTIIILPLARVGMNARG